MTQPQSVRHPERFPPTKVSAKGQTVIPSGIRRLFHISAGSRLRWEVRGHAILVYPVSQDPLGASMGALKGQGPSLPDFLKARHSTNSA